METVSQKIATQLGRDIVSGRRSGSLGSETEIADEFKTSRASARTALKTLEEKRLFTTKRRAGMHVSPEQDWDWTDPDVIYWALEVPEKQQSLIRQLYQFRRIIEPAAAELAAEYGDETAKHEISQSLKRMMVAANREEKLEADISFHKGILAATGNPVLQGFSGILTSLLQHLFERQLDRTQADDLRWIDDHSRVFHGIANKDPSSARNEMYKLLGSAEAVHDDQE